MSLFEHILEGVPDSIFAMMEAFAADTNDKKVNLSPGIYRDDNAKTWVLPSVQKAREILVADQNLNHDISPQMGNPDLVSVARQITFKDTLSSRIITSMQTISGTGANHFIARLLSDTLQPKTVWLSNPTWENHPKIWTHVNSAIEQHLYPYYDYRTSTLDIEGMISTLKERASRGDVIILQVCAHNPTGLDPSMEDWETIAEVCEEKGIFPVLDSAYQGFATGDADNDAWAIRHFAARSRGTMEFAVTQSFSKNFGLYGERVGVLHIVTRTRGSAAKAESALKTLSRAEITSAPAFGAKVVATILQDQVLREQWQEDLKTMSGRLRHMRKRLYDELIKRNTPGNWAHLLTDIGMFSYMRLSEDQLAILRNTFHVYLLPSSRLSWTGLTSRNVEYVAESIHKVVTLSM
ncbi:PLP-dependent transferase [Mollisia scopiformis]|uniref:Aspartate aminotransferase n=1 Tax=Mollisia scopiformis TaxID=149040 RepID=A0A194XQ97_MOLSC|nr:PLP-dependent transferase [Mollisia scopiformis]KUJ22229.1 PLP-dependent transferase [Mollisia scopiformis]